VSSSDTIDENIRCYLLVLFCCKQHPPSCDIGAPVTGAASAQQASKHDLHHNIKMSILVQVQAMAVLPASFSTMLVWDGPHPTVNVEALNAQVAVTNAATQPICVVQRISAASARTSTSGHAFQKAQTSAACQLQLPLLPHQVCLHKTCTHILAECRAVNQTQHLLF